MSFQHQLPRKLKYDNEESMKITKGKQILSTDFLAKRKKNTLKKRFQPINNVPTCLFFVFKQLNVK